MSQKVAFSFEVDEKELHKALYVLERYPCIVAWLKFNGVAITLAATQSMQQIRDALDVLKK